MTPTLEPVEDVNTIWILSAKAESCDEACARNANQCAADQTARIFGSESELINAFLTLALLANQIMSL